MKADLSTEFWVQPDGALGDENLQLIYADVTKRLREENPDADTLELMLMERVAFLYAHIRMKEQTGTFAHDRAHKETLQLWNSMASDLRKQRSAEADIDFIRESIRFSVMDAIDQAIKKIPIGVADEVKAQLLESLEEAGI